MKLQVEIPVESIMTRNLITLNVTDGLEKAEHLLKKHNIRHIPVVNAGKIVGMLSTNDIHRISFADGAYREEGTIASSVYEMFTVKDLMRASLTTVNASQPISEVAEIFIKEKYHSLPVLEGEKLVGLVTTTDVIKFLLKESIS